MKNTAFRERQKLAAETEINDQYELRLKALHDLDDDLESVIERLEQRLAQDRWRFYSVSVPAYAVLGGLTALALTPGAKGLTPD